MKTKQTYDLRKIIDESKWYYVNDNLTTENFPTPERVETEGWKLIKMNKSFSSQEALDKIKAEDCRPANAYELALWANTHRDTEMPKGVWNAVLAFGQTPFIDGYHRVPYVDANSDGAFEFDLGFFEFGWGDDCVLLAFCDRTLSIGHSEAQPSVTLTLERAIEVCRENGLTVTKTY